MDDTAIGFISPTRWRPFGVAGLLAGALAACAPTTPDPAPVDRLAGVDRDALISVTGDPRLYLVVYRADRIDASQLGEMPATLCAEAGESVRNTKYRAPYEPEAYPKGTRLMFVECA